MAARTVRIGWKLTFLAVLGTFCHSLKHRKPKEG